MMNLTLTSNSKTTVISRNHSVGLEDLLLLFALNDGELNIFGVWIVGLSMVKVKYIMYERGV